MAAGCTEQMTLPGEGWVYLWLLGGPVPSAVPGVSVLQCRLCVGLSWDESAVPDQLCRELQH